MPDYAAGPPAEPQRNWKFRPKPLLAAITTALTQLQEMRESEGLRDSDLLAAFVKHQVLHLQSRPHLISSMSGRRDPCQMSTKPLPTVEVVRLVKYFSDCKLDEESWQFRKEPYSRANSPPPVSF